MHLLRNPSVLSLLVTTLLTTGTAARAQQGGDVTVIIKPNAKPAALPTLFVMCDMVCNWKLDGEPKGQIDAGRGAKVKVEPGQHMVEATTEDGVDQVKQPSTVKPTGQTMVSIELWPIRYARLVAEQEERDKAAQEVQAEAEREARGKAEQAERDKATRERAAKEEAERQPWTDPATGLMWTKQGSGEVSWPQAVYYCRNLRLAGHDDWRLPTIDELSGILDAYMKGGLSPIGADLKDIELPGLDTTADGAWSSSQVLGKKGAATGNILALMPDASSDYISSLYSNGFAPDITWCCRAWCVRRAASP